MHAKKKSMSMKVVVLLLSVVLLISWVAGGTIAFLMTESAPVTNTFVAGQIGTLTLTETDEDKQYTIVPGVDITKDPVVTFNGNNVAAYIFVKVEATDWAESNGTFSIGSDQEMKWTIADGWKKLADVDGVYYRVVAADTNTAVTAETEKYGIIGGNTITVSSKITEASIVDYATNLTFTAYAIQKDGFDDNVAEAWTQAKNATN